jgi:hypothetical protein
MHVVHACTWLWIRFAFEILKTSNWCWSLVNVFQSKLYLKPYYYIFFLIGQTDINNPLLFLHNLVHKPFYHNYFITKRSKFYQLWLYRIFCITLCNYQPRVLTYLRTGGTPILLSGTSWFSATYHVGTRNSCYLRTYFLLVPHDLSKSKVFSTVI